MNTNEIRNVNSAINRNNLWWRTPPMLIVIGVVFVVLNQIPGLNEIDTLAGIGLIVRTFLKVKEEEKALQA